MPQRRIPKQLTIEQELRQENYHLKKQLEEVVRDTNQYIKKLEELAKEQVRKFQQAQVDHDNQVIGVWEENINILLADNQRLMSDNLKLIQEVAELRRKLETKVKKKSKLKELQSSKFED